MRNLGHAMFLYTSPTNLFFRMEFQREHSKQNVLLHWLQIPNMPAFVIHAVREHLLQCARTGAGG